MPVIVKSDQGKTKYACVAYISGREECHEISSLNYGDMGITLNYNSEEYTFIQYGVFESITILNELPEFEEVEEEDDEED